jgi:hypothetical protein
VEISNSAVLIIQGLLTVVIWFVKQTLNEILTEVRKTNGRLVAVETSLQGHFKLDDMRFDELEKRLDRGKK